MWYQDDPSTLKLVPSPNQDSIIRIYQIFIVSTTDIVYSSNKKEKGKLTVKITSTTKFLICTIEDNGIGRKRAGEIKTSQKASDKHKSLGMKITQDRLTLLNTINGSELSMNITDLTDEKGQAAGTRVDIYIPII